MESLQAIQASPQKPKKIDLKKNFLDILGFGIGL